MKKTLKIISLFIIAMMIVTTCFATSDTAKGKTEDTSSSNDVEELSEEMTDEELGSLIATPQYNYHYGDVYSFDTEILSQDAVVYGNVYIMSDNVNLDVTAILGNVYVMANNINISAQEIAGNIYAMGQTIELDVQTYHLYAAGQTITIGENSQIVVDARMAGEVVKIDGLIGKNVYAECNDLYIGENAQIYGDTIEYANNVSQIPEEYKEKLVKTEKIEVVDKGVLEEVADAFKSLALASSIVLSIVIIIVITLAMKKSDIYETDLKKYALKYLLYGLLGIIVGLLLSIILMITVVGFLAGIVLLLAWILLLIISTPIALIELSKLILADRATTKTKVAILAIGLSVVAEILNLIPVIGALVGLVLSISGFGICIKKLFFKNKCCKACKENKEVASEEPKTEEVVAEPVITEEPEKPAEVEETEEPAAPIEEEAKEDNKEDNESDNKEE